MNLRIEKPLYGGAGLARAEGKAVFVEGALPGETVEASVRRDKGSFAQADLLRVLEASPDRVEPGCPYYRGCGGCQYQHAAYAAQLGIKHAVLEEALGRAGLRDLPAIVTHAAEPWGYRNRVRLHVDAATGRLGYRRRGSHALLPVEACPIAMPKLQALFPVVEAAIREQGAAPWCGQVELFTNGAEVLFGVAARSGVPDAAAFKRFCESVPGLAGARLTTEAKDEPRARWGREALLYEVGAERYRVSAGSFFQANRFLAETLVRLATEGARGALAWDLFAGVGLFTRVLGRAFERVVAVEGAPASCADLRENLSAGRVIESDVLGFLRRAERERPDWVVLDPPRAGLGKDGARELSRFGTAHVTYVSCDPATLARDLRVFADSGYGVTALDLVDMFPQTFHLEVVAKLARR